MWVEPDEVEAVAEYLNLTVEQLRDQYLRRAGPRISFMEEPTTKDCIFLTYDAEGLSQCSIYPVRPMQCRTWPFWPANLRSPSSWALAQRRCPGINCGPRYEFDEIQRRRKQTRS